MMKTLKHSLAVLRLGLLGILCLAFGAFAAPVWAKPLEIGVILWRGETEADQSFIKFIKEKASDTIIHQLDAEQNIRKTAEILQDTWKDHLESMDYLFSFGSRNTLHVRKILPQTRFKGTLISLGNTSALKQAHRERATSGERLLLIQTSLDPTVIFETFTNILKPRKVVVPFNLREPQNATFIEKMDQKAASYNITIEALRTKPNRPNLEQQLDRTLFDVENIDLFFLSWDSFLLSEAQFLADYFLKHQMLAIGSHKTYVEAGIPLGIDNDYTELGRKMADQVFALERGWDITNLPIVQNTSGRLLVNRASLQKIAPHILPKLPKTAIFID